MASTLWKFIKSKVVPGQQDRAKLSSGFFNLNTGAQYGFPECPTALAVQDEHVQEDEELSLLAVATAFGAVKVYGAPGVELSYTHQKELPVKYLFFIPKSARLLAIYDEGTIVLLEINLVDGCSILQNVNQIHSSKIDQLSCAGMVRMEGKWLLAIGTNNNELLFFTLPALDALDDMGVHVKDVLANFSATYVPDEKMQDPGAMVSLLQRPTDDCFLLMGFSSGVVVLYDVQRKMVQQIYYHAQGLTSVAWQSNALHFNTTYDDGSYLVWNVSQTMSLDKPVIPYGPFPCLPIHKILVHNGSSSPLILLTGGLPRDRFSGHHSLTIYHGDTHTALDFPGPIVDFVVINKPGTSHETAVPETLLVLLRTQLVAVDLTSDKFSEIVAPYLTHIYAPVTAMEYYSDVSAEFIEQLQQVDNKPCEIRPFGGYVPKYSLREWPIKGGKSLPEEVQKQDLLITAHGDGCIRFWHASGLSLRLLYKLEAPSRYFFVQTETDYPDSSYDVWPPFRKYGYEEMPVMDQRLQVQHLAFDPISKTLAVAGKAGQVMLYSFNPEYSVLSFDTVKVELIGEEYEYVWRGTQELTHRSGNLENFPGFQGVMNVQLLPASEITALCLNANSKTIAIGSAHGFALIDYQNHTKVIGHCTLNKVASAETAETVQQRARRAGDTLRRSLRRIPRPTLNNLRSPSSTLNSKANNGDAGSPICLERKADVVIPAADVSLFLKETDQPGAGAESVNVHQITVEDDGARGVVTTTATSSEVVVNGENGEHVKEEKEITTVVEENGGKSVLLDKECLSTVHTNGHKETANLPHPEILAFEQQLLPLATEEDARKPLEEKVERVYDYEATTVRTLRFTDSFIQSDTLANACLWVGLNNGAIYVYTINLPVSEDKRKSEPITAILAKEIHLRHAAPVIYMAMLDDLSKGSSGTVRPASSASSAAAVVEECDKIVATLSGTAVPESPAKLAGNKPTGSQKLLVASEEQLKIFSLPSLKAVCKYKLSNARFTKVTVAETDLGEEGSPVHRFVTTVNNRGEVGVFTLPGLKRGFHAPLAKKDNLTVVLGGDGEGIYQSGSNELERFSVVAHRHLQPRCLIPLPEGARAPVIESLPPVAEPHPIPALPEGALTNSPSAAVVIVELQEKPAAAEVVTIVVEDVDIENEGDVIVRQTTVMTTIEPEVIVVHPNESGDPTMTTTTSVKKTVLTELVIMETSLDDSMAVDEADLSQGNITYDFIVDHTDLEVNDVPDLQKKLKELGFEERDVTNGVANE